MVTTTDEASAGSRFAARSPSGTSVPAAAATNRFRIIANPSSRPSTASPLASHATIAARMPSRSPLPMPMLTSFSSALRALLHVSSPSARPRTITVSVCVAAVAPMPTTIGMKTASAVTLPMVGSKSATTPAAANSVRS